MLKKYIVFAYDEFYPKGGWKDYHSTYDYIGQAIEAAESLVVLNRFGNPLNDFAYVVNLEIGQIVYRTDDPK